MKIPEARELMFPTLEALATLGGKGTPHEINEAVIASVGFSNEQLAVKKAGTNQTVVDVRLESARTALKRSGEIYNPRRGLWALADVVVSDWERKTLHYGSCEVCGTVFSLKGVSEGWLNVVERTVRCLPCGVDDDRDGENVEPTEVVLEPLSNDPVSGSSMLREAQARQDQRGWLKGATGEYLTGVRLHRELNEGIIVLSDRCVPGVVSNVDHIVIAPSGVWVVETKNWLGKIRYRDSTFAGTKRLMVGEYDRTPKVDAMFALILPVAQVVADKSVDVNGVMILIEGNWGFGSKFKKYVHKEILITDIPEAIRRINQPGPLSAERIAQIAKALDEAFTAK